MRTLITLTIALFLISCSTGLQTYEPRSAGSQQARMGSGMADRPNEPGKCYAKCIQPDIVEKSNDTLGVYAIDEEIPSHKLEEVEYRAATTEWVKKKADRNCQSADPEDCMVWCLVTVPPLYGSPIVSIDSSGAEPMKYLLVPDKVSMIEAGGHTVWAEVLCENDITKNVLQQLHTALERNGYTAGVYPNGRMASKDLKKALVSFQKDNNMVWGQMTAESLEALGLL